jgi:hypothetical protein
MSYEKRDARGNIIRPDRPGLARLRAMRKMPIADRVELLEIERQREQVKREAERAYEEKLEPRPIKHTLRDTSATMTLPELAAVLKISREEVIAKVRAGRLPWPLRDRATGKAAKPYRWWTIELLTHECWNKESWKSERRRYHQELDRREAELYGRPPPERATPATLLPFRRKT